MSEVDGINNLQEGLKEGVLLGQILALSRLALQMRVAGDDICGDTRLDTRSK